MNADTTHIGEPLFILAMDHRDSFGRTLFGVTGTPDADQLRRMREAKSLIFAAVRGLAGGRAGPGRLGILVDEQLGADVAGQARAAGFVLVMPVEASGAPELRFEYGDAFPQHVQAFDPDWIKVLVRFNPADPEDLRQSQTSRLRQLSDWAAAQKRRWLIELLVPPTREQLAQHEDQALFDARERPRLTAEVIAALTGAGVAPGIWKLEGYETTEGARRVLDAIRNSAGPACRCIVLGRNAPQRQVDHWLDVAAPLPGYAGFAVGRSIWEEPLADFLAGRAGREAAQSRMAGNYTRFIRRYLAAGTAAGQAVPETPDATTLTKVMLGRRESFNAAHQLCDPDRSDEDNRRLFGKCASLHGHNYVLEVVVAGQVDQATGYVLDLKSLSDVISRQVIRDVDHRNLNTDVPWLKGCIPTAENLALVFWERLAPELPPGLLRSVRVWETDKNWAQAGDQA